MKQTKSIVIFAIQIALLLSCNPFLAHASELDSSISSYDSEAQKHYREGRYKEAVILWNSVLSIDPANQEAKEGIRLSEEKITKIKDFFGRDVFGASEYLTGLSLRNCIDIAKENHLPLQIAREQINLGKLKVWEARRAFLPSVTLSWIETKGIRSTGKTESIEYGVEAKQPAFHSGELMYTMAQSRTNLKIAEKNHDKVRSELYFEVAQAYYEFAKASQSLEYIKSLYENTRPLYGMAQEKYEKRVVSDIEFLSAESKFSQLYYRSISTESNFKLARLALEQKLNIEDTGTIDVKIDAEEKFVDKDMDTCLNLAMENRPDLKMSEFTVKSTEYGQKIAQAREMPQLDLTGYYKNASEVYRKQAGGSEQKVDLHRKWYAGLEANWPILGSTGTYSLYKREDPSTLTTFFGASEAKGMAWKFGILDNLKQFSEKQEAEIAHIRAEDELNEMRKKAVMEVKEAFYGYEKARIQLEASTAQKDFREKEAKILKAKHGLGEVELSELFESIIQLMESSENYFEAEANLNISISALNKAVGLEDYF